MLEGESLASLGDLLLDLSYIHGASLETLPAIRTVGITVSHGVSVELEHGNMTLGTLPLSEPQIPRR